MADARALLQASRSERKIKHPHASYTSTGKLTCNLCETTIKHESAWQSHLHTSQHNLRLTRAREAASVRDRDGQSSAIGGLSSQSNRKRKADDLDSPSTKKTSDLDRKKARPTAFSEAREDEKIVELETQTPVRRQGGAREVDLPTPRGTGNPDQQQQPDIREKSVAELAELEAFERELAELDATMPAANATRADATISSAPKSAAELAAEARKEQSAQRGKRDAELEGEKEDAAKLLEDEFEEMEGLEQRARKLRERMQALRAAPARHENGGKLPDRTLEKTTESTEARAKDEAQGRLEDQGQVNLNEDEDEDEDDEDDYWDSRDR